MKHWCYRFRSEVSASERRWKILKRTRNGNGHSYFLAMVTTRTAISFAPFSEFSHKTNKFRKGTLDQTKDSARQMLLDPDFEWKVDAPYPITYIYRLYWMILHEDIEETVHFALLHYLQMTMWVLHAWKRQPNWKGEFQQFRVWFNKRTWRAKWNPVNCKVLTFHVHGCMTMKIQLRIRSPAFR